MLNERFSKAREELQNKLCQQTPKHVAEIRRLKRCVNVCLIMWIISVVLFGLLVFSKKFNTPSDLLRPDFGSAYFSVTDK